MILFFLILFAKKIKKNKIISLPPVGAKMLRFFNRVYLLAIDFVCKKNIYL
jgi:hypothetical protein